jgi:glutamate---cysteine ligase / carboxylate-amine ligase
MLLDPVTYELAHVAAEILRATEGDRRFKLELPASQLEILTSPAATVTAARDALLDGRRALAAAAGSAVRLASAGAHPFSPGLGKLNTGPRYEPIARGYRGVAERQLVCALQVHVSVGDGDRALAVYNAARSYLPLIAALAANAPFYEGRDTGLASVRPRIAGLLPRQGVPPAIGSWEEYAQILRWGAAAGAFPDPATWWWELRPHPGFGTLEFRVPDAQSTVAEAAAIAAIVQALVAWLGRRHDTGEPLAVDATWRIEQNRWAACRDGVEGEMAELSTGRRASTRAVLGELLETLRPTATQLGSEAELRGASAMIERNGALAQRHAASGGGPGAVARWLADRFLAAPDG